MSKELKTASVLAFERKLDPSDALFTSGNWVARTQAADWKPVGLREKSVRGTISNRLKTSGQDPAKLDAAIQNPNLQTVDVAALPADADTLKVQFTLRVLGGTGRPSACNDAAYRSKLLETVDGYGKRPLPVAQPYWRRAGRGDGVPSARRQARPAVDLRCACTFAARPHGAGRGRRRPGRTGRADRRWPGR